MAQPVIPITQIAQFAFEFVDPAVVVFVVGGGGGGRGDDRAFQHPEEASVTRHLLDVDDAIVTDVDVHQGAYQDRRDH